MSDARMSDRRPTVFALLGIAVAACGSGAATGGDAGPGGNTAACTIAKTTLAGQLDGQTVAVQADYDLFGFGFGQGTPPYNLDYSSAGFTLHLQWTTQIAFGQTAAVTGAFVLPPGSPHAGETICAGAGTLKYVDRSGQNGAGSTAPTNYIFSVATLSSGPACSGVSLAGSIDGCLAEADSP